MSQPYQKLVMRDFRQKEKKELPQNKPSRDESSLPRCNISSMAGSAAHGCFVNCHGLRRKKNTYNITKAKNYALHCWWTVLESPCSLDPKHGRGITPGQAGLVTARFVLSQLLFFLFCGSPSFHIPILYVKLLSCFVISLGQIRNSKVCYEIRPFYVILKNPALPE